MIDVFLKNKNHENKTLTTYIVLLYEMGTFMQLCLNLRDDPVNSVLCVL